MCYIVRKISQAKWEDRKELGKDAIQADAVTCDLRTEGNRLSFWECVGPNELEEIVLALASNFDKIKRVDVVWIDKEELKKKGIEFEKEPGVTPVGDLKGRHINAINLEINKLYIIAESVAKAIRNDHNFKLYKKRKVCEILYDAIQNRRLSPHDLSEKVKKGIEKQLGKSL